MVKATDGVYKYVEVGFAVRHKKDGFKAGFAEVSIGSTDEQRPESLGSDARDLCDIIHIRDCSEQYISLPFYTLEEMLIEWIYMRFIDLYEDFRFKRGDNTLLIYAF